ncbi:MAG: nucleotidyltransferase [Calditrichaeota bacterium]|nr:MAG: nucleotidyltransferase [Calditrichota bacterium]
MKLDNSQLQFFVKKIKLRPDNMQVYRDQISNLKQRLENKIKDDDRTGLKVTKYLLAGSWKKHTILRPTGDNPIDIDLVLFIEGDEDVQNDLKKVHDFIVEYLEEIYPQKDIKKDVDKEGNKSIKIKFSGTGLEVDIVPVVPINKLGDYVWQPERGGGGKYITSVSRQLDFALGLRKSNSSYTSIVRMLKWWKNYKEINQTKNESGLSSFSIELIVAYLDIECGVEDNIEEAVIRFFQFLSKPNFPVISFKNAINKVPEFDTPIFIADNTNNENNVAKKLNLAKWKEVIEEAEDAFDSLNFAQARNNEGDTIEEWKRVFGPTFGVK